MKISVFIFLLVCLKVCLAHRSLVDFDVGRDNSKRFPFMTVISNSTSLIGYGSIIHPRAVLTLALMEPKPSLKFGFKVHAYCYIEDEDYFDDYQNCIASRKVVEYHIIEQKDTPYNTNLSLLILAEPFKLSKTINVVSLNCDEVFARRSRTVTISLRTLQNSRTNAVARFFAPIRLFIQLGTSNLSAFNSEGINLIDDKGHLESFQNYEVGHKISFVGAPIVCQNERNTDWCLVGISNFELIRKSSHLSLSDTDPIMLEKETKSILKEIIKKSYFPQRDVSISL